MKRFSKAGTGLVLIELLIAVTVAALIIGTILAVYVSVLNTVSFQNRWRVKSMPAAEALDFMVRDMSCLVLPGGITNPIFTATVSEDAKEKFKMCFYSAFPAGTSNAWRYSIGHVCYSLQAAGLAGKLVLVRESLPFRIPPHDSLSYAREEWPGIRKMEIAFYDGSIWTNQWGGEKKSNSVPRAAHIKLFTGIESKPQLETEVFINVGRRIVPEKSK